MEYIIQVRTGSSSLVLCILDMKLACWVFHCNFGSVLLPYVSKNDDEELCFLKWFGFGTISNLIGITLHTVVRQTFWCMLPKIKYWDFT